MGGGSAAARAVRGYEGWVIAPMGVDRTVPAHRPAGRRGLFTARAHQWHTVDEYRGDSRKIAEGKAFQAVSRHRAGDGTEHDQICGHALGEYSGVQAVGLGSLAGCRGDGDQGVDTAHRRQIADVAEHPARDDTGSARGVGAEGEAAQLTTGGEFVDDEFGGAVVVRTAYLELRRRQVGHDRDDVLVGSRYRATGDVADDIGFDGGYDVRSGHPAAARPGPPTGMHLHGHSAFVR